MLQLPRHPSALSPLRVALALALVLAASLLAAPAPAAATEGVSAPALLPGTWVRTAALATLWSGPDAAAVAFGPVPAGRPLRVEAGSGERVLVRDPGDGLGHPGGPAWVDRLALEPVDQPRHWFAPADPERGVDLWSGPDERAVFFGLAGPDRPLAWVGPRVGDRLPVLVADAQPGLAWASVAALAPGLPPPPGSPGERAARLLPPQFPPPAPLLPPPHPAPAPSSVITPAPVAPRPPAAAPATPALPPLTAADREAFIAAWGERARRLRPTTGLPPSLVVSIAINETGWGRSRLAREANNFFGIKAGNRPGSAGTLSVETWEVVDGRDLRLVQVFRAYLSPDDSLLDLARHLRDNPRYAAVWTRTDDPDAVARAMLAAGYATDPAWADKLARIRTTYGLDRFDR